MNSKTVNLILNLTDVKLSMGTCPHPRGTDRSDIWLLIDMPLDTPDHSEVHSSSCRPLVHDHNGRRFECPGGGEADQGTGMADLRAGLIGAAIQKKLPLQLRLLVFCDISPRNM